MPPGIAFGDLLFDPAIGFLEAVAKPDGRFPAETIEDQGVVAVAAVYTFRSAPVVGAREPDAGNLFHKVDEAVDADKLTGPEIDRLVDVAVHNHLRTFDTVVNEHEAASLPSVPPDIDFVNTEIGRASCRERV